jgi:hypothetical protein
MRYAFTLAVAYLAVAAFTTALWIRHAKTETHDYSRIVSLADGTAQVPFVKRRLLPDLARGLAALVPPPAWDWVRQSVPGEGEDFLHARLRGLVADQRWLPQNYPILFSAYFLIACSALGFQFTCRWLVHLVYQAPWWLADVLGALLGLALLGGCGERFYSYPYDFPTCFLFTLTLAAMLGRRWWFVLAFAAAAYCKETSVLLIAAYALTAPAWRSGRFLRDLGLLAGIYLLVRGLIDWNYPTPPGSVWGEFWYPLRNLQHVLWYALYYAWFLPLLGLGLVHLARHWPDYPVSLRRLAFLLLPLLVLGFFKGWIEERRQYLEFISVFGLIVAQWLLIEAGLGRLLRPLSTATEVHSPSAPPHRVEACCESDESLPAALPAFPRCAADRTQPAGTAP